MIACDTASLNGSAACFSCLNEHQKLSVKTFLLCQIVNAASAGDGLFMYWSFNGVMVPPYPSLVNAGDLMSEGGAPPDTFVPGIIGNAMRGGNFYHTITIQGGTGVSFTDSFSFSCWVKVADAAAAIQFIIGKGDAQTLTDSSQWFLIYSYLAAGTVTFLMLNEASLGTAYNDITVADTSVNTWHHFVGTYDHPDRLIKLYRDGVLVGSTSVTGGIWIKPGGAQHTGYKSGIDFDITICADDNTNYQIDATGAMDEVGFWLRVLNQSEVEQLYNGGAGITYPF